nr:structure-specific endonuclease subunit slx1 [Tanacetum cinerariifolium]
CSIILPRESESVLLDAAILEAVAAKKYPGSKGPSRHLNATRLVCVLFMTLRLQVDIILVSKVIDGATRHVYLILSTNPPIKTYVGVTNNFSRRLKQHNGELKGGAKASQAGRPWICACIIHGFETKSEVLQHH